MADSSCLTNESNCVPRTSLTNKTNELTTIKSHNEQLSTLRRWIKSTIQTRITAIRMIKQTAYSQQFMMLVTELMLVFKQVTIVLQI